ncbi:MAG TPA: hypothetical protein PLM14_16495 [Candidatus Hydrogenedentes bacterium]|nr:hypothetical protein [Candidatus Hydrogenedentota bacterium]HQH51444.1 hypothetical protein [Candidatus Hydrogenedentota bacterium]
MRKYVECQKGVLLIGLAIGALMAGGAAAEELRTGLTNPADLGTLLLPYEGWWGVWNVDGDNALVGYGRVAAVADGVINFDTDQLTMSAMVQSGDLYGWAFDLGFFFGANLTGTGGIACAYYVDVQPQADKVTLGKIVNNVDMNLAWANEVFLQENTWYDLVVTMSGGVIRVWVDGLLLIEYDDSAEVIPSGMAGMYSEGPFGLFDNFILLAGVPPETVELHPKTLNLQSKIDYITCYIELPGFDDVADIDRSTILLAGGVPAEAEPWNVDDRDQDGEPDLMVKFDRLLATDLVPLTVGDHNLAVTWYTLDGRPFKARATIRVISAGKE